jgi:hypothetical protein
VTWNNTIFCSKERALGRISGSNLITGIKITFKSVSGVFRRDMVNKHDIQNYTQITLNTGDHLRVLLDEKTRDVKYAQGNIPRFKSCHYSTEKKNKRSKRKIRQI